MAISNKELSLAELREQVKGLSLKELKEWGESQLCQCDCCVQRRKENVDKIRKSTENYLKHLSKVSKDTDSKFSTRSTIC